MVKATHSPRKSRYAAAIVVNAVMIYVFANLQNWGASFLTSDYTGILWAIDFSLGATIVANMLFLAFDPSWFRHLLQVGLNAIALFVAALILAIFPFTFAADSWAIWVKVGLILAIVGIGIATIVEFLQIFFKRD